MEYYDSNVRNSSVRKTSNRLMAIKSAAYSSDADCHRTRYADILPSICRVFDAENHVHESQTFDQHRTELYIAVFILRTTTRELRLGVYIGS